MTRLRLHGVDAKSVRAAAADTTGVAKAADVFGGGQRVAAEYLADVMPKLARRVRLMDLPAMLPSRWAAARAAANAAS